MYCLALLDSGNYVFNLCRIFEKKGFVFEVVSTPCHLAKDGCGYCLKFPIQFKNMVVSEGLLNRVPVREIYKIVPMGTKNRYEKIY